MSILMSLFLLDPGDMVIPILLKLIFVICILGLQSPGLLGHFTLWIAIGLAVYQNTEAGLGKFHDSPSFRSAKNY